jgi:TusA-related sulfurtransferase
MPASVKDIDRLDYRTHQCPEPRKDHPAFSPGTELKAIELAA